MKKHNYKIVIRFSIVLPENFWKFIIKIAAPIIGAAIAEAIKGISLF